MIYGDLFEIGQEKHTDKHFALQNSKLLKVTLGNQSVMARTGSMVAYQGQVGFEHGGSGGLGKMFKAAATGEGVPLMKCSGQGELFLADNAADVQILYLENDAVSVNGASVLAFSTGIEWDIHRIGSSGGMSAGGVYNVALSGTGFVAVTTKGTPVALDVASAPTFADPQAVVLWTAGVKMDVRMDTGGLKSLIRGGSGETFQLAFGGQGLVLVQPAENVIKDAGEQAGGTGGLAGLFN